MLFNSYIFTLFFLPVCVLGYYCLNCTKKYALGQVFLLVMSLWFYSYFNKKYLLIILISIVTNYLIYFFLCKIAKRKVRKLLLISGVTFNLAALIYFKYMDFFISNINNLFNKNYKLLGILLPLGISFFTFQQLSFIIDAYRGEVLEYNFLYYASYVTFFPQLVAGPIVTHEELIPQFLDEKKKVVDWDNLAKGIYIFVLGLSKKVLLADTFGNAVAWGYENLYSLNSTNVIIVMLSYTIQIYFDFSGYCDMAIGIGKMFNIDLPVNFNSPYKALTITEFWDRWHITLTRFLTKYVYIPLGGNRKGKVRTYINILIVFLASGFWHGASWNFVFWGGVHGVFLIITRQFKNFFERLHPALNWLITFSFVNVTWVFFRADSLPMAIDMLNRIAICDFGEISMDILSFFKLSEIEFLLQGSTIESKYPFFLLNIFLFISMLLILGSRNSYEKMETQKLTICKSVTTVLLLVWCIISFSGVSSFLYFNF